MYQVRRRSLVVWFTVSLGKTRETSESTSGITGVQRSRYLDVTFNCTDLI